MVCTHWRGNTETRMRLRGICSSSPVGGAIASRSFTGIATDLPYGASDWKKARTQFRSVMAPQSGGGRSQWRNWGRC
jgi:hypothetical protein